MGVENRIKQQYGSAYWLKHKDEIVDRLQGVPQQPARVFGESARSRRVDRRARLKRGIVFDLGDCILNLREDMTLQQISQKLGIPRSTLYRHRRGLVRRTSLLKETLRRCEGLV